MECKVTDKRCRRYIRIEKENHWETIDELMQLPAYKSSFNKVINDALDYGLPLLYKSYFGVVEEECISDKIVTKTVRRIDGVNEEYFMQIVRLLKEVILSETINKSILCSLFEAKNLELNGQAVSSIGFYEGLFRDIPDYLAQYEIRGIKDIRK